jgi:hypothetical protein
VQFAVDGAATEACNMSAKIKDIGILRTPYVYVRHLMSIIPFFQTENGEHNQL